MSVPLLLALLALLAVAALLDLRHRRIPNWLAALAAVLGVAAVASGGLVALGLHAAVSLLVLLAGMAIWSRGWLGGGDVKLLAALALWAGPGHVAALLVATTLAGGVLATGMILVSRAGASPLLTFLQIHAARLLPAAVPALTTNLPRSTASLPYGLAVAAGGAWLVHLILA